MKTILEVKDLSQIFEVHGNKGKKSKVVAVNGVSFTINEGETFGLVGESGSGKSTTGRCIIGLNSNTSGNIIFDGKDITKIKDRKQRLDVAKNIQMIFQDPFASVNPRMTVEDIIGEGISIHFPKISKQERKEKVIALLEKVGLSQDHISRYPHEFSGGQLQRIGIARALAIKPKFIIADEAISALDVSIQAQVVNLMMDLQKDFNLTYLFIAHDLSMVKLISDRIGVMYKGKLLEIADANQIYENPIHPYTKSLLSAIPNPDPIHERTRERILYDDSIHDYSVDKPVYHQIDETHVVYCTVAELNSWT